MTDFFGADRVRYRTLSTAGGGRYTLTVTAKDTTLSTPMLSWSIDVRWSPDGDITSVTLRGLVYKFTVPGRGVILLETGRAVFDDNGTAFEAGPHQILDGDVSVFCAAFSQRLSGHTVFDRLSSR